MKYGNREKHWQQVAQTFSELLPKMTVEEVSMVLGRHYGTVLNWGNRVGYKFRKCEYRGRKAYPERLTPAGKLARAMKGFRSEATVFSHIKLGAPTDPEAYKSWVKIHDMEVKKRKTEAWEEYLSGLRISSEEKKRRRKKLDKKRRALPEVRARHNARMRARKDKNRARYYSDPQFRIAKCLRTRTRKVLNGKIKSGKTMEMVGCTAAELKVWLEKQFAPGMTWENYGHGWHIDHKRPLASFDLMQESEQCAALHFTNLQPLWATENMSKGDKWQKN